MKRHDNSESGLGQQQILQVISDLQSHDGMTRRQARKALQHLGHIATPRLIELLDSSNPNGRWEAAKALGHIADPTAGPALVRALMDESFEVQWLAAEALIALGVDAVEPLLDGLVHNYGSLFIRQGAHHVFHDLERKRLLSPVALRVLDELRCLEPLEPFPISAKRALQEIRSRSERVQPVPAN